MKIVWIKNKQEENNNLIENIGISIYQIENLENIDEVIKQVIEENYKTILLSSEIAAFSEDIIKKYSNCKNVNIIITP